MRKTVYTGRIFWRPLTAFRHLPGVLMLQPFKRTTLFFFCFIRRAISTNKKCGEARWVFFSEKFFEPNPVSWTFNMYDHGFASGALSWSALGSIMGYSLVFARPQVS
jgi:hypothetical protein